MLFYLFLIEVIFVIHCKMQVDEKKVLFLLKYANVDGVCDQDMFLYMLNFIYLIVWLSSICVPPSSPPCLQCDAFTIK